jgi:hypothetical protein
MWSGGHCRGRWSNTEMAWRREEEDLEELVKDIMEGGG